MGNREYEELRYPKRIRDQAQVSASIPGKATNSQTLQPASSGQPTGSNGIYASPGNLWTGGLKGPGPYRTGSALADRGLGCAPVGEAAVHDPCFLDPTQRDHILSLYQQGVGRAHSEYLDAIQDVKLEEVLRREVDTSQWLFEVFVDVISLVGLNSLKTALRNLLGGTNELPHLVTDQQRAINELSTVNENNLAALLGSATNRGRQINQQKQDAERSKSDTEKAAALSYFGLLKREASLRFQRLQNVVPAGANDAELLVLFHAYDDPHNGNTSDHYAGELKTMLTKFKAISLSKLGVHQNNPFAGNPTGMSTENNNPESRHWKIATAAFWVTTPIGRRLALYRKGHEDMPPRIVPLGGGISHEPTADEISRLKKEDLRANPFVFQKFVPGDLVDAAIQMHVARWGTQPDDHPMTTAEFQAMAWDM